MLFPLRVRRDALPKPALVGAAGTLCALAALVLVPLAAGDTPISTDAATKVRHEGPAEFTAPAAPPSAAQRAQLDAKRAMVERMTPHASASPAAKAVEVMTVVPGAEGAAPLKPFLESAPAGSRGMAAPRIETFDIAPYLSWWGCRETGLCKSGDFSLIGTERIETSAVPTRVLRSSGPGRQP